MRTGLDEQGFQQQYIILKRNISQKINRNNRFSQKNIQYP